MVVQSIKQSADIIVSKIEEDFEAQYIFQEDCLDSAGVPGANVMMTQEDEVNMQLNMAKVTEYDVELLKENIKGLADDLLH